jgi:hypothetical protein
MATPKASMILNRFAAVAVRNPAIEFFQTLFKCDDAHGGSTDAFEAFFLVGLIELEWGRAIVSVALSMSRATYLVATIGARPRKFPATCFGSNLQPYSPAGSR